MGMDCDEKPPEGVYCTFKLFHLLFFVSDIPSAQTRTFVLQTAENGIVMKEDVDCSLSVPPYTRFLITGRPMLTVPARLV